ncbi:MAG: Gfo/Idh/MocA family oxidoreductase [Verrucomicrobiota bacterium]|nr:Gfo/Idh/MocA family oxidoreductase [Verrucomicrobiota bacterium]
MYSDKKTLPLAMIGCGGYAAHLIEAISELPDVCKLLAVTTPVPDDPAAQTCREKGLTVYNSADELFENLTPETCSAVMIPTSIDSHYEYARKAVARGFHVLLEKPPVATIQDLDRLIDLQRESGKFISVNFQHLFNPMTQKLKAEIAAGEFGAIRKVAARALWMRPESYFTRSHWSGRLQIDGRWVLDGTVGNPLAHLLAEALYLASPETGMATPANVQAELYHANGIESEDTSCLRVKTKEGVPVFFTASLCSRTSAPVLCEVETERAVIRLVNYFQLEIIWNDGRVEKVETPDNDNRLDRRIMLKAVAESLTNNERPLITVEECRPYMLAWNGAFESFGVPSGIDADALYTTETAHGTTRCIQDIQALCEQACARTSLFSGLGVSWAKSGLPVDLDGYSRFPSINRSLDNRSTGRIAPRRTGVMA